MQSKRLPFPNHQLQNTVRHGAVQVLWDSLEASAVAGMDP